MKSAREYATKEHAEKLPSKTKEASRTILTLSIECVAGRYWEWPFRRVIEAHQDMTLGEVAWLILHEVGFDSGDHLSTFFIGAHPFGSYGWLTETGEWERDGVEPEDDEKWEIPLSALFPLPKRRYLYYWYDFGDDWKFEIRKKGKPHPPVPRRKYPRLIEKEGRKPTQYPRYD